MPPTAAALQVPSQVMVHVPEVQVTFEPAPAVCVQLLPAHDTAQPEPQVPVQVAPDGHEKLQPAVELEHASNEHV